MFQKFYTRIRQAPLAIISLVVCMANWQLLFGLRATQWDMINFWLPWRHFIAQCYTNGIVPLWNPYSQAGYPMHGDLQGPAYSPDAILSSFLSPINIYFLNFLYIFYLILGAYGLYKLVLFFINTLPNKELISQDRNTTLFTAAATGVAYGICGFNAWHGHYLYITISACLVPWIYYYFFRILDNGSWLNAVKLALFVWWQVTAGNPSFIIVSFYFLAFVFICRVILNLRKKTSGANKKLLLNTAIAGLSSLVLCAPVFLNAYYVFPETSRAGGISAEWAAEESILWRNIFAVFSSITCIEREIRIGAEAPIYDLYIGIPTIFFALFAIIKLRSFWINMFSCIAILALLLSLGLQTPLFRLFHSYLPFFNVFRMPNLIIIYTLMYLCAMAALGFLYLVKNGIRQKHFLYFSAGVIALTCIGILYFKYGYPEKEVHVTDYSTLRSFLWSGSQARKLFISLIICIVVLALCLYFIRKQKYKALLVVLLVDVAINYNLGSIARVFGEIDAKYSNSFLSGLPTGFAPADNIEANKTGSLSNRMNALWMNSSVFLQQPSYMNDNNFELTNYMTLMNERGEELNYFVKYPLAYLADSLVSHANFIDDTLQRKVIATVSDSVYAVHKALRLQCSPSDTVICKEFQPHHFVYETKNAAPVAFVLHQNFTKLWKVNVNGKEVKPALTYYSFPLITLEAGTNHIEFVYEAPHFHLLFVLSLGAAACFVLAVILSGAGRRKWIIAIGFGVIVIYCAFSFFNGQSGLKNSTLAGELADNKDLFNKYNSIQVLNTRDGIAAGKPVNNLLFNEDLAALLLQLKNTKADYLSYICYKSQHSVETEALLQTRFGMPVEEQAINYGFIRIYKKEPQTTRCIFSKENNFDADQGPWIVRDTVSGNGKLKLMKGNEFGGGTEFIPKDIGAKAHDLVYAECDLETAATEMPGMCISIDREGTNKAFVGYGNLHLKNNKKTALVYRLPDWIKETDKITVFYWNNTGKPAIIDNMSVQVIRMD